MRSIIATGTLLIATLRIWRRYQKACIAASLSQRPEAPRDWLIWKEFDRSLVFGIDLKKVGRGIVSMWRNLWVKPESCENSNASNAGRLSFLGIIRRHFAPGRVAIERIGGSIILPWLRGSVLGAEWNTNPPKKSASLVERNVDLPSQTLSEVEDLRHPLTMQPVYNLSVEWPNCYYANGVLVHNCDSTSMGLSWVRRHGVVVRKVEHEKSEYERKLYRRKPGVPYAIA